MKYKFAEILFSKLKKAYHCNTGVAYLCVVISRHYPGSFLKL